MKVTVNLAKMVIQPPNTYTVEFTEQELVDILAMSSHVGGFMRISGRDSWAKLQDAIPKDILVKAYALGDKLVNSYYDYDDKIKLPSRHGVGAFYPEDGIIRD